VFCRYLKNSSLTGKPLLSALHKAVSIYTNYTGTTNCLSIQYAEPGLDTSGAWDYQACTEMVMPMCTDGVNDMFEPAEWNFKNYNNTCFKKYSVSSQPYLVCHQYGCKNLSTVTNINFRYVELPIVFYTISMRIFIFRITCFTFKIFFLYYQLSNHFIYLYFFISF